MELCGMRQPRNGDRWTMRNSAGRRRLPSLRRLVPALGFVLFACYAAAQENATTIALGSVSGPPKGTVTVPMYLTPNPPSRAVGKISAKIHFENKGITFVRGEKGFLLDGVNGTIRVEEKKQSGESVLDLEVATQGEPRKSLRDGLVMTLVFTIQEDAQPETKIDLKLEQVSATDVSNPPSALEIAGKDGSIEIISPDSVPYIACFFFTH